jgi:hypothetical protein
MIEHVRDMTDMTNIIYSILFTILNISKGSIRLEKLGERLISPSLQPISRAKGVKIGKSLREVWKDHCLPIQCS